MASLSPLSEILKVTSETIHVAYIQDAAPLCWLWRVWECRRKQLLCWAEIFTTRSLTSGSAPSSRYRSSGSPGGLRAVGCGMHLLSTSLVQIPDLASLGGEWTNQHESDSQPDRIHSAQPQDWNRESSSGRPTLDAKTENKSWEPWYKETRTCELTMDSFKHQTAHILLNFWTFQTIISATQSRKKQQTELVRSVLYAEMDKKRKERENLPITSLPVEMLAAQEPSLSSAVQDDQVWCPAVSCTWWWWFVSGWGYWVWSGQRPARASSETCVNHTQCCSGGSGVISYVALHWI